MSLQPSPEKLAEWLRIAQDLAGEHWTSDKIEAQLRKRGCDEPLAKTLVAQARKHARKHGRRRGVVTLALGIAILAGFTGVLAFGGFDVRIPLPGVVWVATPIVGFGMVVYGTLQILFG